MWLEEIFSKRELEEKTRNLYYSYKATGSSFDVIFEDIFSISYRVAFKDMPYDECMLKLLGKYYPNEWFVKNVLRKKRIKNHSFVFEFPINNSRADAVEIGKKLSCYEIKTKYDSLDRLSRQIEDYAKFFEYVYVVCSSDKVNKVTDIIPEYCGIISYKDRSNCSLKTVIKAQKSPKIDVRGVLNGFKIGELKSSFKSTDRTFIASKFSSDLIMEKYKDCLISRCS